MARKVRKKLKKNKMIISSFSIMVVAEASDDEEE